MTTDVVRTQRTVLSVRDLHVSFAGPRGPVRAVNGVSFDVAEGELVAVVGESGSGKTVMSSSILRLLNEKQATVSGSIQLGGTDLGGLDPGSMAKLRGSDLSIIFQDPLSALNPLMCIGHQVRESLLIHGKCTRQEADARALDLLRQVEMPDPEAQFRQYPHQMSGGMNQRAMIAMALACDPVLLVADEPTTALDATTQLQIMGLIRSLARARNMAVLMVTHDLGVVSEFADRVLIMYAGQLMEDSTREEFFDDPRNPYSRALLEATPRGQRQLRVIPGSIPNLATLPTGCVFHPRCELAAGRERCRTERPLLCDLEAATTRRTACHFAEEMVTDTREDATSGPSQLVAPDTEKAVVLELDNLVKEFTVRRRFLSKPYSLRALDGVSLSVAAGETLAIVGESGSGKSTMARVALRLIEPTSGRVRFQGKDLTGLSGSSLREARKSLGLIFQDPDSSLDPYLTAGTVVAEPLVIQKGGRARDYDDRVCELFRNVGLDPERRNRYPREFSGGERQRLAIARALALEPALIVCDEPTTMLDVSVQAQVLALLRDIQARAGVSYLFIAHDLAVVRQISHRVAVMYAGKVVETCDTERLFTQPFHPYSVALLSASAHETRTSDADAPIAQRLTILPPDRTKGCPYAPTCWKAQDVCRTDVPALHVEDAGHEVACHFPELTGPADPATEVPQ